MARKSPKIEARHIKPDNVMEGDTIRITSRYIDTVKITQGKVARIRNNGGMRTLYTERGVNLLHYYPRNGLGKHTIITLVDITQEPPTPLEGF